MKKLFFLLLILFLTNITNVHASEPLTFLKGNIDRVFNILSDPQYSGDSKKDEQHNNLWNIMNNVFDFKVMSRLTLANNWKSFTSEQQREFAEVFGEFLGNTYLDKMQSGFSGEQVEYIGEDFLSDRKAVVMTNILRNNIKTPINYSMVKTGTSWKIYDIKIEGISLLKNYRSQFRGILIKDKPEELIKRLKKKLEQYNHN